MPDYRIIKISGVPSGTKFVNPKTGDVQVITDDSILVPSDGSPEDNPPSARSLLAKLKGE